MKLSVRLNKVGPHCGQAKIADDCVLNDRSCSPTREGKFDYAMDKCEAVTLALAGMVIENYHACLILWGWVITCIGHLAVTKFSQLFEVTLFIPVVNSYVVVISSFSRYTTSKTIVLRGRLFTLEFVPVSICVDTGPQTFPQGVGLDIYILN